MGVFGKRKPAGPRFDRTGKEPVVRSSICTGEKVAGYRETATGRFVEDRLIRDDKDLEQFLRDYDFDKSEIKYEW